MSREYTMTLYRGGGINDADENEREYVVTYCINGKYRPATRIDPEEYPEVELIGVACDGLPFASDEYDDWFVEQITDQHDPAEEAAERAEYRYEQLRDRRMMED